MKKTAPKTRKPTEKRSDCPVANVLDLLGDKWTLLVIRDMLFFGKSLYKELAESDERIPTNILADRLRRMESSGLLVKEAYQKNPLRFAYRLTLKGLDVLPILRELMKWAFKHFPGVTKPDPKCLEEIRGNIRKAKSYPSTSLHERSAGARGQKK